MAEVTKHRINAPQRGWSFPWETQTDPRWAGTMAFPNPCPAHWGQYLLFAEARRFFRFQLLNRDSCNLANDSIVSLRSLGCATRRSNPSPSPTRPGVSVQHLTSQGSRGRTWCLGRRGTCALVATSPGAQLPARSLPETLKWSGLSSAQRTTLSNCFPFYSQAGS